MTDSTLSISWTGLEGVTAYSVRYQSPNNQLDVGYTMNVTTTSAHLTGLAPGTDYTVTVAGITEHGLTLSRVIKVGSVKEYFD